MLRIHFDHISYRAIIVLKVMMAHWKIEWDPVHDYEGASKEEVFKAGMASGTTICGIQGSMSDSMTDVEASHWVDRVFRPLTKARKEEVSGPPEFKCDVCRAAYDKAMGARSDSARADALTFTRVEYADETA